MDSIIEKKLESPEIKSQEEMKQFVSEMQSKITLFEKNMYDMDGVNPETLKKIKAWRSRLLEIVRSNRELPAKEDPEEREGLETLKLLNRQLEYADLNQKILDKSTLKLASLDFSTDELDKVIAETRKRLESNLKKEEGEYRRLILAFTVFICVCIAILIDKIRLKL
ncbi:uncharacterized protein VICG_02057 [Vittaforma corneae ATCC 50505]|uniref:Uncharacterized protein n=1 Tax=Vittaforma corneae (strain ATCC 50505) TaxID=993615 RepID=L2GKU2_VITCO|nr:uncharacterized protein VICG_02057 [Vittaforma corneae ATCC 50505]ELA40917.1 hypothetical protein VICG_02057 [Vittaforma corneae ATCC 50505]